MLADNHFVIFTLDTSKPDLTYPFLTVFTTDSSKAVILVLFVLRVVLWLFFFPCVVIT